MKAQVYIDLLIIAVFMVAFISFTTYLGMRARETATQAKVREEFQLLAQQLSTAFTRFAELGAKNPIQPKANETILLGVFDLGLPEKVVGMGYEIEAISGSEIWVNVENFTFDGELVNYQGESPNPKILLRTLAEPKVSFQQPLPNLGAQPQGKFKSGFPGVMRYYRYNLNGKIYDALVLSSYLVIHLESLG